MKKFNWQQEIKKEELNEVIQTLENGGIVIFPTDTVYGVSCNCKKEESIKKLYEIKKRPNYKPINVLTNDISKIKLITRSINNLEQKLIEKYMPGALTLIMKKNEEVPSVLTAGLETIGVRIPQNEIALSILEKFEYPLAVTSVNLSGEKDGTEIDDFYEEFKDKVDIIIDGGKSKIGVPSTIVKVKNNSIEILRRGTINIDEE